jgi:hypothetical protein
MQSQQNQNQILIRRIRKVTGHLRDRFPLGSLKKLEKPGYRKENADWRGQVTPSYVTETSASARELESEMDGRHGTKLNHKSQKIFVSIFVLKVIQQLASLSSYLQIQTCRDILLSNM